MNQRAGPGFCIGWTERNDYGRKSNGLFYGFQNQDRLHWSITDRYYLKNMIEMLQSLGFFDESD